jgi:hypothetical protein
VKDAEIERLTQLLSTRNREVAQVHRDDIEQLKRAHTYQQAKLRTAQKPIMDDLQAKTTEVERLTLSLSASQAEVSQLRNDLVQKSDELQVQKAMMRNSPMSDGTQKAISEVLGKEICAHTMAKNKHQIAIEKELLRLGDLGHMIKEDHTSFDVEINHIRHSVNDFDTPDKVVKELDELDMRMDILLDNVAKVPSISAEDITEIRRMYMKEHKERKDALVEVAKLCRLWDRVREDLAGREGEDEDE